MSTTTAIEWTDTTWNPTTGCTKVSPGCANCYIERTPAFRIASRRFERGHIPLQLHPDRLEQPLHWRKPRRVFVNSLSDLFHEHVPDVFIAQVWTVMAKTPQHTYQVLTKRPERMRQVVPQAPLPNVWLGVSVENQHFKSRLDVLAQVPAAVRFVSLEPLLENIGSLKPWIDRCVCGLDAGFGAPWLHANPTEHRAMLDWVIVGGESGPRHRPIDPAWVREIRDQCEAASVAFFFKQWGGQTAKSGGRLFDGRTYDDMPARLQV